MNDDLVDNKYYTFPKDLGSIVSSLYHGLIAPIFPVTWFREEKYRQNSIEGYRSMYIIPELPAAIFMGKYLIEKGIENIGVLPTVLIGLGVVAVNGTYEYFLRPKVSKYLTHMRESAKSIFY